jgi:2-amino-4-hydroxy-6-hydroxymethyldihydropteridine diphosphokinase
MDRDIAAYIALGSNRGDRLVMLRRAVSGLHASDGIRIDPVGVASLWESAPVGLPPDQEWFYNSAVRVFTLHPVDRLLQWVLEIERLLGRTRGMRNESRVIDLDLLLYDSQVFQSERLIVPHPRMHERRFVLEPLAEIAGEVRHPVILRTISELRFDLMGSTDQVATRIMGPKWCSGCVPSE